MNENEEFDELPPIEVDCLGGKSSNASEPSSDSFVMPAADELALQRQRELLCEQELRALPAPLVARCDSSGLEGEAALAAAVQALSVLDPVAPAPGVVQALSARSLLTTLLPHLPPAAFLDEYLHATDHLDETTLAVLTDDMVSHVCALVWCDQNVWSESETVALGAWLCAVSVSGGRYGRGGSGARGAARVLRELLEARAAPPHAAALSRALAHAPPAALLPLADALGDAAGAAGSLAARLATDLCDAALAHYLQVQEVAELVSARRGALQPDARYAVVLLVGRRLAAWPAAPADPSAPATPAGEEAAARARLLRELERAPAPSHRYHAEHLKVSVGVSKLQSLFGR